MSRHYCTSIRGVGRRQRATPAKSDGKKRNFIPERSQTAPASIEGDRPAYRARSTTSGGKEAYVVVVAASRGNMGTHACMRACVL